jgi:hypothetical protein
MELNPESIDAYTKIISDPQEYSFTFTKLQDFFVQCDTVTAKHILAKQYLDHIGVPLPKVVLYIIMDNVFGQCNGKDENGNFGYYLKSINITI